MPFRHAWNFAKENNKQIAKYATVGLTAGVVDFSILFILTDLAGWHYLVSATFSFILSALVNYTLNRIWTFRSNGKRRKQLPVFFIIATLGLLINNNMMYISVEHWGFHYLVAKILASALVTFWNFFGNKYFTFRIK
ncbi:GtrA family protein [Patescibacteria group bacterium]|nr:GtrA family protein [Patescibacteria group bacterium]